MGAFWIRFAADEPRELRPAIAALAFALRSRVTSPHSYPTSAALKIARNVGQALADDPFAPEHVIAAALSHRRSAYGLQVANTQETIDAGARAWLGAVAR